MKIRFNVDPETGEPHIYGHGVDEDEVHDVLQKPIKALKRRRRKKS